MLCTTCKLFKNVQRSLLGLGLVLSLGGANAQAEEGVSTGPSGEVGLNAEIDLKDPGERLIGPAFRLYGNRVTSQNGNLPFRETAFVEHISWADLTLDMRQGTGTSISDATNDMSGDAIGATASLRWVVGHTPFSLTVPYSGASYRWMESGGETQAKLRLQTIGLQPGWYLTDSVELVAGAAYMTPDFWARSGDTSWDWLAWDIWSWWLGARGFVDLQAGRSLAFEGKATLFRDQQGNRLISVEAAARFYLTPTLGLGADLGMSNYSGSEDSWGQNLRAMGTRNVGLQISWDPTPQWGLVGVVTDTIPEADGPASRLLGRGEFRARF